MTKSASYYRASSGTSKTTKKISLKVINISLIAVIAGLGFFHLINISDLAAKGFILKDLKSQVNILMSEKLENEEKINNLQSYYSLSARAEQLNLVAVNEIDYLSVPSTVLVRR